MPRYRTYAQFGAYVLQLRDDTDTWVDEARALKRPAQFDSMVAQLDRLGLQEKSLVGALANDVLVGKDPRQTILALRAQSLALTRQLDAVWQRLGVPSCTT